MSCSNVTNCQRSSQHAYHDYLLENACLRCIRELAPSNLLTWTGTYASSSAIHGIATRLAIQSTSPFKQWHPMMAGFEVGKCSLESSHAYLATISACEPPQSIKVLVHARNVRMIRCRFGYHSWQLEYSKGSHYAQAHQARDYTPLREFTSIRTLTEIGQTWKTASGDAQHTILLI